MDKTLNELEYLACGPVLHRNSFEALQAQQLGRDEVAVGDPTSYAVCHLCSYPQLSSHMRTKVTLCDVDHMNVR